MAKGFKVVFAALMMALVLSLMPAVSSADDCIFLKIDDVTANPGDDILVPVLISDVTGWGAMAFEATICWCPTPSGLLQLIGCEPGPVLTGSGWTFLECNPCSDNCISIASAGISPLMGTGPLFYVKFHVSANAKPCMCCDVWFTDVNLYDPEIPLNVCLENGKVCIESCSMEGTVNYWKCCFDECDDPYLVKPLQGVYVHLWNSCVGSVASQYTDAAGYYKFDCLDPLGLDCMYCTTVDYCPLPDRCITAFDAALILKYLVCLDDLMDCPFGWDGVTVYPQMIAADVNCSSMITAYDASLILQYVVGLINVFPCADMWAFYALGGNCENTCPGIVDWIGILKGDPSGCPDCPPTGLLAAAATAPTRVKLGKAVHYGDRIEIPVTVKNAVNIESVQLDIEFDTSDFAVVSVQPTGLANGFMCYWNDDASTLRVAMAGMTGFSGRGKIATITLQKLQPVIPSYNDRVEIVDVLFNEGMPDALIEGSDVNQNIVRFGLGPVSPNPFVDGTVVKFNMAKSANVSLSVYNVNGQLVSTLIDGTIPAGQQSIAWNGTDFAGNKVARGVYFCRMATEDFSATEKIVLLK